MSNVLHWSATWADIVWQPRLPPKRPDLERSALSLRADEHRSLTFSLALLPDSRRQFDREHTRY